MKNIFAVLSVFVIAACSQNAPSKSGQLSVASPDKTLTLEFVVNKKGEIGYQVLHQTKGMVIDTSALGFAFKNMPTLDRFEVLTTKQNSVLTEWTSPWGQNKQHQDSHNELLVKFKEKDGGRLLNVRVRAFNDGVGFRYEFPQQDSMNDVVIMDEKTQFILPTEQQAWWIEANYDSYEKPYQHTPLSQVKHANTPLTMVAPNGLHISIHEAALTDYSSMTLISKTKNTLEAELVPWANGEKVVKTVPFNTPWRTIQISDNAAGLANSDLILNLNEPNQLADTSWIKPMTYMGIWWEIHLGVGTWNMGERHAATTERAIKYIDFAVENNVGGVLFEGWNKGWGQWGKREAYVVPADDFDLQKVADYAREKGVKIIGHNETEGRIEAYESHVEEIFKIYTDLGINTVKTGYVAEKGFINGEHHQGQYGVNHYRKIVKLAAQYKIMINAHEPIKDTGIRRTWPNMMTREGAKGGEWNAWSEGNSAEYLLTLPFTRLLAGPMDYTPGIFDIDYSHFEGKRYNWAGEPQTGDYRVHTTLARQLADMVILYSPLQMASDAVENYEDHPAFTFIRDLKMDFESSFVVDAKIGEYITVVRQTGNEWFIGSGTNNTARTLRLTLDFLPKSQTFIAEIYRDDTDTHFETNPESYKIEKIEVTSTDELPLILAPGGGQAIRISAK
ncbi:glycoside hydrolase family 97 protein [Psychrosphaera sp. B3R10]|uniref:glycoside hydrolase family 97 protein n=1 Tax=unclassified Psychrosphaera TaxID=2641570 RepID=UPI001C097849|nr:MULTISPECIES: glycoside hydrolase family 97 protein [unclassified Psychrosphaera]MBU2883597.1 glycoside hydrolase family 97 protein [Psychrosphaera sp. I2R16]MBU2989775.1 glycoside hydrolase family 97 protein [Psychrosphaera sp. B3R10]